MALRKTYAGHCRKYYGQVADGEEIFDHVQYAEIGGWPLSKRSPMEPPQEIIGISVRRISTISSHWGVADMDG